MLNLVPANDTELLATLRALVSRVPSTKQELVVLVADSLALSKHIQGNAPLGCNMPHEAWHFLSDADIRFKSPEYGQSQARNLTELLANWEKQHGI